MFRTGDKVVCISPGRDLGLEKDAIYTVIEETKDSQGSSAVMLLEIEAPFPFYNFLAHRFRKALPADLKKIEKQETVEL